MGAVERLGTQISAFDPPSLTAEQWAERNRLAAEHERGEAEAVRRSRIERSGIPAMYRAATLDGCPSRIAEWCAEPSRPLMLRGDVGLGKTWAACAALAALAATRTVLFGTLRRIADDVRVSGYGDDALGRYARAGALCIDDLGKDRMTESRLSLLFEVVKARDEAGLPTIYTTNYGWADLLARLSAGGDQSLVDTIASRLTRCLFVDFEGRDRRLG